MSVSLALQMRQHLALTPRLQQSLRLLQLSSLEFQQELRQALDQNPFLEDGHGDEEAAADAPGSWPRPPRSMRHPQPDDARPQDGDAPEVPEVSEVSLTAAPAPRGTSRQRRCGRPVAR